MTKLEWQVTGRLAISFLVFLCLGFAVLELWLFGK